MVVAITLFWVVLGLTVLFIAIQGGPRRARESLYSQSPALARVLRAGIFAIFVFGLAVPALVLIFNGEDKASVGAGGVHLNVAQQKGRVLFSETCAFCHTLRGADAVGRTGPNLDVLVPNVGTTPAQRKAFVLSSIEAGFAGRYGQMPKGIYSGREAAEVAAFVAAVAGH
jgi:mono/diheme cytochrome c family protein